MRRSIQKKSLSALLSLLLILALFAGFPASASAASGNWTDNGNYDTTWYTGTGTAYTLGSAAEFAGLAVLSNGMGGGAAVSFADVTVTLGADIDLSAHYWTPIGLPTIESTQATNNSPIVTGGYGFAGTFDGGGRTIAGLTISGASDGLGLFGYLAPGGAIENLTVSGSVSVAAGTASDPFDAIGGVAGYNSGTINKVIGDVDVSGGAYCYNLGGIAGFNNHLYPDPNPGSAAPVGVIANCSNAGAIAGQSKVGGIAGENAGAIGSSSNSGPVSNIASGKNGAGGIAGRNGDNNTATETGVIVNCFNSADITGADGRWLGGITGFQNKLSSVLNCYDTGDLLGGFNDYAPIVGQNEGTVTDTYSLEGLNSSGDLAVVGTVYSSAYMQGAAFVATLNANSAALGFGDAWLAVSGGYPDLTYNANIPDPSGGGGTPNDYEEIYLSPEGNDGYTGSTPDDPVQTLDKALEVAAMSTNPAVNLVVLDTIPIASVQRALADRLPVNWAGDAAGPMFRVAAGGGLTMGGLLLNGNNGSADIGVAMEVAAGGALTVRNNASIGGCAVGIDVESGGALTLNRSYVSGTDYSVKLADGTSSFTLFAGPDQTITLDGTVWLGAGAYISVESALTSDITVECEDADAGILVAETAGEYAEFTSADVGRFAYPDDEYTFVLSNDNTEILLGNPIKK
jgi:hypothetical protein